MTIGTVPLYDWSAGAVKKLFGVKTIGPQTTGQQPHWDIGSCQALFFPGVIDFVELFL